MRHVKRFLGCTYVRYKNADPKGWSFYCRFFPLSLSKFGKEEYVKKNNNKKWILTFRRKTYRF